MALLPLQRGEGGGGGGGFRSEGKKERWRQRLFMCNDTITKPACKTQSANCAFEGDFQPWISVRQRDMERKEEKRSQVDVIDRGGVCLKRACVCVLKRSYLFGSTSRRLCGHHHTVICLVSRTGLKLTSVNPIFVSGMTKCLSSGLMLLVG